MPILERDEEIAALVRRAKRIAVLGIKTEDDPGQPAFYVPAYLVEQGLDVVPVPVYYPDVKEILGRPVHRRLVDVPPPRIDLVDVFRRAADVDAHVDDLLAARPLAVWFQSGIRNDRVARRLADAGIDVVQNRCLMIEHQMLRAP